MKVVSLFSGGKDSMFALWCALMQGWDVVALVTVMPENKDSWMFHYPGVKWTNLQAEALGIKQIIIHTQGEKETELKDLESGLEKVRRLFGIDGMVSGAVASEYQRTRLDLMCDRLGIKSFAPLWHKRQEELVREQIEFGFEIIVTACSALGLGEGWLGRRLGLEALEELIELKRKYGLSIALEGGEGETFVLKAPFFQGRISIVRSSSHWHGDSGHFDIEDAKLERSAQQGY